MIGSLFISCSTYSSSINLDDKVESPNGDEWLAENIEFSINKIISKEKEVDGSKNTSKSKDRISAETRV